MEAGHRAADGRHQAECEDGHRPPHCPQFAPRDLLGRRVQQSDDTDDFRSDVGIRNPGQRSDEYALDDEQRGGGDTPVAGARGHPHARQSWPGAARERYPAHQVPARPRRRCPAKLHADKGYDFDHLR